MNYNLIFVFLSLALLVYLAFQRNKIKDISYEYLLKYLSEPNSACDRTDWIHKLYEQFDKEVNNIYKKDIDNLTDEEVLELFTIISKQKKQAFLENRSFHNNALKIIYYKMTLKIIDRGIMNEEELKEFEYQKLKEKFSQTELSKLAKE